MKRKEFLQKGLATGTIIGSSSWVAGSDDSLQKTQDKRVPRGYDVDYEEVKIEWPVPGKPHKGKVLLAIPSFGRRFGGKTN